MLLGSQPYIVHAYRHLRVPLRTCWFITDSFLWWTPSCEKGLLPFPTAALRASTRPARRAFAYVKAAGLDAPGTAPDNRTLLLNPTLCDALFKVGSLCVRALPVC